MTEAEIDLDALVLASKTAAPTFKSTSVHRTGLIDALRASPARIITVTAAAGYGKTSMLAEWWQAETREKGWVTLRSDDDDPASLVRLLAQACAGFAPASHAAIGAIRSAPGAALGRLAPALAVALAQAPAPFVLFVDDVHVLRDAACMDIIDAVFARIPPGSQVVLASRQRLAQLARRRDLGTASDVTAEDLRIDAEGAGRIANEAGVEVPAETLQRWVDDSDGWAAGIHMFALLSHTRPAAARGEHTALADYLYHECIRDLPEDERSFLLSVSVLDLLIPELCDAILDRSDSARILRDLEDRQLFITADPARRAYRLHPLFREYLENELSLEAPSRATALHSRAMQWFAERGELPTAIEHAILAADFETATQLVAGAALRAYEVGESATLGRWLRAIGDARLLENASAVVVITWFAVLAGGDRDAHKWATLLERVADDAPAPGINVPAAKAMIRAITMPHGAARALDDAEAAVALEPLDSPWRDPAVQILGSTLLHAGHRERATVILDEAIQIASAHDNPSSIAIAESEFALLAIEDGDWDAARERSAAALEAIDKGGLGGYVMSGYARAGAACVHLSSGDVETGTALLTQAMSDRLRCGTAVPLLGIPTRLLLARAQLMTGNAAAARILLDEIAGLRPTGPMPEAMRARIASVTALLEATTAPVGADQPAPVVLTAAEQRLLPYLQTYLTRKEMAQRLFVSPNTVSTQLSAVFRKLGAASRSEAVARALELELIGSPRRSDG